MCAGVRLGRLLLYRGGGGSGGGGHQLCTTARVRGEESAVGCRRRWRRSGLRLVAGVKRKAWRHTGGLNSTGPRLRPPPPRPPFARPHTQASVAGLRRRGPNGADHSGYRIRASHGRCRAFGAVASRGHLLRRGQARLRALRLARRRARRRRQRYRQQRKAIIKQLPIFIIT